MRRRVPAFALLLAALFGAVLLVGAGPAGAHATVVATDPIDGSRLKAAPSVVTITFDQAVSLGSIGYLHVTDQTGRKVDAGAAFHPGGDGAKIADKLKSGLGDGTYTASFRIVSADSHPVAGTIRFVVGNGALSGPTGGAGGTVDTITSKTFDAVRWISFAGFALLVGSWLVLVAWPAGRGVARARRLVWCGLGAAVLGTVAEELMQGPYTAGTGLGDMFNWPLFDGTLHTDYGQYHSLRLLFLGLAAAFFGWALSDERARWTQLGVGAALAVGMAVTFAGTGHAATTNPEWVSMASDVLHVLAMAAWLGGLALLTVGVLPRREPDELRVALPAFSRVALIAIATLAITGLYQALRGVQTVDALFTTTYGQLVVVKVVLFGGIVLLGNFARTALHRDVVTSAERVRRSVLVEIVLAVGVLVATSILVAQPRGSEALAVQRAKPRSASAALGSGRTITVTLDPGKHGVISTTVELSSGAPPQNVTATASLPSKQIGPIPIPLTADGRNLYGASGITFPSAGAWVISLVVTTSQFHATTTSVTIRLY